MCDIDNHKCYFFQLFATESRTEAELNSRFFGISVRYRFWILGTSIFGVGVGFQLLPNRRPQLASGPRRRWASCLMQHNGISTSTTPDGVACRHRPHEQKLGGGVAAPGGKRAPRGTPVPAKESLKERRSGAGGHPRCRKISSLLFLVP